MAAVYQLLNFAVLYAVVSARPRQNQRQGSSLCPTNVLRRAPGTIRSPGYQDLYPADQKCTWVIVAPIHALVSLKFVSLDMKTGPRCVEPRRCQCDQVQIREVKSRSKRNYPRKFCKGHYPKGIISTSSNKVRVTISASKRFVLKYWFRNKPRIELTLGVNEHSGSSKLSTAARKGHMKSTERSPINPMVRRSFQNGVFHRGAPLSRARRVAPQSNNSGVIVMYREDKEKVKKEEEEEAEPPGAIVLGPAVPIILIFLGVVASIAWWQFRSDQKERLRYYKEQIRYEEISNRSKNRFKKKKQNMREMRMKKLYGDMARNWQGTQTNDGPPQSGTRQTKRSFAGRLLELAEKPVSYIRTPRGSRPSSMVQEQGEPLVVMREKKAIPGGRHPPSRPASVLLRDALNMIFGATTPSQESASETPKEPRSENDSKRTSLKRVSFYDIVLDKMDDVKHENENSTTLEVPPEKTNKPKPAQLSIPHIMVRQPSCEAGGTEADDHRRSPLPASGPEEEEAPKEAPHGPVYSSSEPLLQEQFVPLAEQEPLLGDDEEQDQDSQRPRSFEKQLVEMLEVLRNEKDEFPEDDVDTDVEQSFISEDQVEHRLPPASNQTPVPRDSGSSEPSGKANCADLEDFLLNLDKELEANDNEP